MNLIPPLTIVLFPLDSVVLYVFTLSHESRPHTCGVESTDTCIRNDRFSHSW